MASFILYISLSLCFLLYYYNFSPSKKLFVYLRRPLQMKGNLVMYKILGSQIFSIVRYTHPSTFCFANKSLSGNVIFIDLKVDFLLALLCFITKQHFLMWI